LRESGRSPRVLVIGLLAAAGPVLGPLWCGYTRAIIKRGFLGFCGGGEKKSRSGSPAAAAAAAAIEQEAAAARQYRRRAPAGNAPQPVMHQYSTAPTPTIRISNKATDGDGAGAFVFCV
jgi:hypothetical protein